MHAAAFRGFDVDEECEGEIYVRFNAIVFERSVFPPGAFFLVSEQLSYPVFYDSLLDGSLPSAFEMRLGGNGGVHPEYHSQFMCIK